MVPETRARCPAAACLGSESQQGESAGRDPGRQGVQSLASWLEALAGRSEPWLGARQAARSGELGSDQGNRDGLALGELAQLDPRTWTW